MGCGASSGQIYTETTEEPEKKTRADSEDSVANRLYHGFKDIGSGTTSGTSTGIRSAAADEPHLSPPTLEHLPFRTAAPFGTHSRETSTDAKDSSKEPGRWHLESSPGTWVAFKEQISANVDKTRALGKSHLLYVFQGETHDVDLDRKIVTNWFTGHSQRIEYRRGDVGTTSVAAAYAKHIKPETEGSKPGSYRTGEWQWQQNETTWLSFDSDTKQLLRAARLMGREIVCFVAGDSEYEANLETCVQRNLQTGYERKLRWVRPQKESAQFQWQLKNGTWVDYEDEENEKLCAAYAAKQRFIRWSARGNDYQLDFAKLIQENVSTNSGMTRNVRILRDTWGTEARPEPSVCKASGSPIPPSAGKRFGFHGGLDSSYGTSPRPSHTEPSIPPPGHPPLDPKHSARRPSHGSSTGPSAGVGPTDSSGRSSGHPPFAKAFSAFHTKVDPGSSFEQRKSSPYSGHGSSSERYDPKAPGSRTSAGSSPPPGGTRIPSSSPPPSGSTRAPSGPSHPRAASGTGGTAPAGARGKATSAIKLPSGVDWPGDTKARKAAEELFYDLSKVPINERKKTFMKACLRWHPDKNLDDEDTATEVFQFLQTLKEWYLGE
mmetsp:Transcript_13609/g.22481  ORF Transcript_13609/g.22481 Transcript_13609/m.22481 type:complete len:604 (-) Transcript_13609:49-1860(-)